MSDTATIENFEAKGLSPAPYMSGSIFVEGYGSKGAKPRPFNYHLAVRQYHTLAYGLAMLNANACAGVPLRMFSRRRSGVRKMYETRPASKAASRYLSGYGELKPSPAVAAKVAAWGYEVEEVVEPHPALKVMANPNPNDNGYEMATGRFLDLQIIGNSWWYVVESRLGVPQMLFRMPAHWTTVKPNEKKTGANRVAGYVYGKNTANEVEFTEQEVDHFRMPNPRDAGLFYGMGWYEAGWGKLGLANAKLVEDTAFKDNMSRPDWMLSVDGGNQDSLNRLESKVNEKYRGPENSGKFMLMAGKVSATALQFELKELGTPDRVIDEIAFIAGVPVSMLLTNDSNRAGSEGARLTWYRTTIRNYCLGDEQKLNQRYLPRFAGSEDYLLCYDHVSFEDRAAVAKEVVALVSGGIISPNEGRQELGYQEAEGADLLYPPAGNTSGSAGVQGNTSPQQNDELQDRKSIKAVARMPKVDASAAREESEAQFKRDVYMQAMKDPTAGDAVVNMIDVEDLTDQVGIRRRDGMKMPVLPIIATGGPIVNGKTMTDASGAVIGGAAPDPAPEIISIREDARPGAKPPVAPSPADSNSSTPPSDTTPADSGKP